MTIQFVRRFVTSRVIAPLFAALVIGPAWADVELRVEARPISDPIQAFVNVTDTNGDPIPGLTSAAFTVTIDGDIVPLQPADLTLPPDQDSDQKVSVVFVMDYTTSVTVDFLPDMESSVIAFIDAMNMGDYAAIIKFNTMTGASVVQAFIVIDQGVNNDALEQAVTAPYPGDGSNILDATNVAVEHMTTQLPLLPAGPKAVILVTDGLDNDSSDTAGDVIGAANVNGIPIFSIGVGNPNQGAIDLLTGLSGETGGEFIPAPTGPDISNAYVSISELLNGEYLLTIPSSISDSISDCVVHSLDVTVAPNGSASVEFTRRICDTEPDPFAFTSQTGVARGNAVISNTVTITGLEIQATGFETPADISTQVGSYSIGCNGTFTGDPGTISNGQTVCVRHTASSAPLTSRTTTLTIGGVAGTFTSTTAAAPPEGGGGGGGATGGIELLLGVLTLIARQRRRV